MSACLACSMDLPEPARVCPQCGAARAPAQSEADERATLHEWRLGLNQTLHKPEPHGGFLPDLPRRDRFLQNALIPSGSALLIEEALHCEQLMESDVLNGAAPRARLHALVTRLELLSLEEPTLQRRVQLFRKVLDRHGLASARANRNVWFGIGGTLLFLVGAIWLLARSCG